MESESTADVARVNNTTSLVVEPFPTASANLKDSVRTILPGKNGSLALEGKIKQSQLDYILRITAPYSSVQSLRVLPHCFRYCNTDYLLHSSEPTDNHVTEETTDFLSQFLSTDSSNNLEAKKKAKILEEKFLDDDNTVIVHPLYLKSALQMLLQLRSDISVDPRHIDFSAESSLCAGLVGQLFKDKTNPNSASLLVKIRISEIIRPFHISIPSNARKVLHLQDFDRVFLKIIDDKAKAAISPTRITLTLTGRRHQTFLSGGNQKASLRKNIHRTSPVTSPSSRASSDPNQQHLTEAIKAAFFRMIDNETPSQGFFLLSSGQILSLSLPSDLLETASSTASSFSLPLQTRTYDFIVNIHSRETSDTSKRRYFYVENVLLVHRDIIFR